MTSQIKLMTYYNKFKKVGVGYALLLPSIIIYAMFLLYPLIKTVYNSFQVKDILSIGHYITLLNDPVFVQSAKNTLLFVIISVPLTVGLSLLLALFIVQTRKQTLYMAIFYLPAICSGVSIFLTWKFIYKADGILNSLTGLDVNWLGHPRIAIYALIAVLIYIAIGQPIILYVSAINNIPESLIEAGDIEGINWFQRVRYITLPLIKPTTLYIMVIRTIGAFNVFVIVQLLTGGGPYFRTSTLSFLLYQRALSWGRFNQASAIGVILLIVVMLFTIIQVKWLRNDIEY